MTGPPDRVDGGDQPDEPTEPIAEPTDEDLRSLGRSQLSPRKIVINLVGSAIGLTILIYIVWRAVTEGDWRLVRDANPLLLIALIGATAGSAVLNAMMFWVTARPLRHLRLSDMLLLNVVANMLNYAPIRLGALTRIGYHMRVDRLGLITIGAWFSLIFYLLVIGVAAFTAATLIRPTVDGWWLAIAVGLTALAGYLSRLAAGLGLAARVERGIERMRGTSLPLWRRLLIRILDLGVHFGGGIERIIVEPVPLWGGLLIRLLDLGMFAARMVAALAILGITLSTGDAVLLALVAFVSSLTPIGRVGVREGIVALVAMRLGQSVGENVSWEQLAVVESAGEAIFYVPLGAVGLVWLRKKWISAGPPAADG